MLPHPSSLAERRRQPELMDQPGLDAAAHTGALAGLARLNRVSRSAATIWRPIERQMRRQPSRQWRLLDVASGAGDVAIALSQLAARSGYSLSVEGCDMSERAVDFATQQSQISKVSVRFFQQDVLATELPGGFDFITTSLFLHHLDDSDAIRLLRDIGNKAQTLGVVSDLRRTKIGYAMAVIAGQGLTRSPVVHVDGPLSVKAAYTIAEVQSLARQASLNSRCEVRPIWPQRYLMTIQGTHP